MATHSSIVACKIPWTEEPGGLQSMGSQRVEHDCSSCAKTLYPWHARTELGALLCALTFARIKDNKHPSLVPPVSQYVCVPEPSYNAKDAT